MYRCVTNLRKTNIMWFVKVLRPQWAFRTASVLLRIASLSLSKSTGGMKSISPNYIDGVMEQCLTCWSKISHTCSIKLTCGESESHNSSLNHLVTPCALRMECQPGNLPPVGCQYWYKPHYTLFTCQKTVWNHSLMHTLKGGGVNHGINNDWKLGWGRETLRLEKLFDTR